MPKYTPTDDEMDDLYANSPSRKPNESEQSVDEEEAAAPTALVPKSCLPAGVKEGDTCRMRVVADHGEEVEVESVSETKPKMMSADEELDGMSEED